METKRGYKRYWILTGTLGLMILHPLSFDLSPIDSGGISPPQRPTERSSRPTSSREAAAPRSSDPERTHSYREKKILDILSRFETGLERTQEEKLAAFIQQESRRYGFDPELIVAVISTESSFYNWSISPKGAVGLMQIIPTTGKEIAEMNDIVWRGKDPLFDPFLNIRLGIHYLWILSLKFGDLRLALAAYNHGPGKVLQWLRAGESIPMGYAEKVLGCYRQFLDPGGEDKGDPRDLQTARRS